MRTLTKALLITALPLFITNCSKNMKVNENSGNPDGATFVPLNFGEVKAGVLVGTGNVTVSINCPNAYPDGSAWSQSSILASSTSSVEVMTSNAAGAVTCTVTLTAINIASTAYTNVGGLSFALPTTGSLSAPSIVQFSPVSGLPIYMGGVASRTGSGTSSTFQIDLDYSSSLSDLTASLSSIVNGVTTVVFTQENILPPSVTGLTIQKSKLNLLENFTIGGTFANFTAGECKIFVKSGSSPFPSATYVTGSGYTFPANYTAAQTLYANAVYVSGTTSAGVYSCNGKILNSSGGQATGGAVNGAWGTCTINGAGTTCTPVSPTAETSTSTLAFYKYDWFVIMRNTDAASGISSYTTFNIPKQTAP